MKKLLTLTLSILGLIFSFSATIAAQQNEIKLGTVPIEIRMHGDKDSIENLMISFTSQKLFGKSVYADYIMFTDNGNGNYTLNLPVETFRTIGHLRIANQTNTKEYAWGNIELTHGTPYVIDCTLTGSEMTVNTSDSTGFNRYSIEPYKNPCTYSNNKYRSLIYGNLSGITHPRKIYAAGDSAWHEVLRQMDEVFVSVLDDPELTKGMGPRENDIVRSNLAYSIYGLEYFDYDYLRKTHAPYGNREMPPLEYYDFLNRIDYSHLTDLYPFAPPYFLLTRMLHYLPVDIEPIGEMPVRDWQRQTADKLGQVINEVPDILLRLLSATSYAWQLDWDKKTLTPTQIKNISEGYDDDLGKIILNKNEQLKAELDNASAK